MRRPLGDLYVHGQHNGAAGSEIVRRTERLVDVSASRPIDKVKNSVQRRRV